MRAALRFQNLLRFPNVSLMSRRPAVSNHILDPHFGTVSKRRRHSRDHKPSRKFTPDLNGGLLLTARTALNLNERVDRLFNLLQDFAVDSDSHPFLDRLSATILGRRTNFERAGAPPFAWRVHD
jgi:hypothetical protein